MMVLTLMVAPALVLLWGGYVIGKIEWAKRHDNDNSWL